MSLNVSLKADSTNNNWIDLNANNIQANKTFSRESNCGTLVSVFNLKYTNLNNVGGAGPVGVSAEDVVSGIVTQNGATPTTITLPPASSLASLFPSDIFAPITFEFKTYTTSGLTVQLGANCQKFPIGNNYTIAANSGAIATFYGNASGFDVYVA
jgi:hypothetical protein